MKLNFIVRMHVFINPHRQQDGKYVCMENNIVFIGFGTVGIFRHPLGVLKNFSNQQGSRDNCI